MIKIKKLRVKEEPVKLKNRHYDLRVIITPATQSVLHDLESRKGALFNIYKKDVIPLVLKRLGLHKVRNIRAQWVKKLGGTWSLGFRIIEKHPHMNGLELTPGGFAGKNVHVIIENCP